MMKVVILLLCVLVVSASAANFGKKVHKKAKGEIKERGNPTPPPCFHVTGCLATGTQCSDPCTACPSVAACIALAQNETAACKCYNTTNACYLAIPNGAAVCAEEIGINEGICTDSECPACPTTVPQPLLSGEVCNFNSFCPEQSHPTSVTSCTPDGSLGAVCNSTMALPSGSQCQDFAYLVPLAANLECVDNKCVYPENSLYAGDSCKTSDDCQDNIDCTNGVCVGGALNAACDVSADCAYGLYCGGDIDGTCLAQLANGKNCSGLANSDGEDDTVCGGLSTCGPDGSCIAFFSVANGGACVPGDDQSCAIGSFCKVIGETGTGVCAAAITTPTICNATTGITTGTQTCETNYGADSGCACDFTQGNYVCTGGTSFSAGPCTNSDFVAAAACAAKNKCILSSNIFDSRSCARTLCAANFNCIINCLAIQSAAFQEQVAIGCATAPVAFTCAGVSGGGTNTASGASSGSSVLEVSFASVALMVVAALLR